MMDVVLSWGAGPLGPRAGAYRGRVWHYRLDTDARTVTAVNGAPLFNRKHDTNAQVVVALPAMRGPICGMVENADGDGLYVFYMDGTHKALPYWTPDLTPGT